MAIGDRIQYVLDKAMELHAMLATLSANVQNLEKQFDKLAEGNERFVDRVLRENDDLRRRISTLEGIVNSTFANSLKQSMTQALKDYIAEHGKLPDKVDPAALLGPPDEVPPEELPTVEPSQQDEDPEGGETAEEEPRNKS